MNVSRVEVAAEGAGVAEAVGAAVVVVIAGVVLGFGALVVWQLADVVRTSWMRRGGGTEARRRSRQQGMSLRWYSIVVDCRDVKAQAVWWSETLDWPIVYESDDEAVISPPFAAELPTSDTPPLERWPGFVFVPVPEEKTLKNRLHIDLAPAPDDDQQAAVDALLARGATLADVGQGPEVGWVVLRDPEGNEFCVLSPRE